MRAYSTDLKERLVRAVADGQSIPLAWPPEREWLRSPRPPGVPVITAPHFATFQHTLHMLCGRAGDLGVSFRAVLAYLWV